MISFDSGFIIGGEDDRSLVKIDINLIVVYFYHF